MSGTYDDFSASQVCPSLALMPILVSHQAKQYLWDAVVTLSPEIAKMELDDAEGKSVLGKRRREPSVDEGDSLVVEQSTNVAVLACS